MSDANCPAAVCGSRAAAPPSPRRPGATSSRGDSVGRSKLPTISRRRPSARWNARRSTRWPSRARREEFLPARRLSRWHSDATADGRRKLDAALRRSDSEKSRETPVIAPFSGAQLDLALSRPNVVHAALLAGPGSETFIARTERLLCFRTGCRDRARSKGHASAVGAQDQGCK